jgi:hypothetical protein
MTTEKKCHIAWQSDAVRADTAFPKYERFAIAYVQIAGFRPAWEFVINLTRKSAGEPITREMFDMAIKALENLRDEVAPT